MNFAEQFADLIGDPVVARDVTYRGKTKTMHFREMSAGESEDMFLGVSSDMKANKGLRARMIAACLCDAEGKSVMNEAEAAKLPNTLSMRLQAICFELNGLGETGEAEAKNAQ